MSWCPNPDGRQRSITVRLTADEFLLWLGQLDPLTVRAVEPSNFDLAASLQARLLDEAVEAGVMIEEAD